MEHITEMLNRLADLSEGEVAELEGLILSEFEAVEKQDPTTQTVDSMTALADALDAVRTEQRGRVLQQEELKKQAAEAASRVRESASADPVALEEELPEDEDVPDVPAEEPAGGAVVLDPEDEAAETPEDEAAETPEDEAAETPEDEAAETEDDGDEDEEKSMSTGQPATLSEENTVTASGEENVIVTPPASSRPVVSPSTSIRVTAGADIPGITAGAEFANLRDVSEAFAKRLHGLRRVNGGDGEQHIVASIQATYPEERSLSAVSDDTWNKIAAVVAPQAITAAGGCCAPLTTKYDLFSLGNGSRPVRDALPSFQADRGGIRFTPAPVLGEYGGGIGTWTCADDADPAAAKVCTEVACKPQEEALLEAITLCLQFKNMTSRAYPELIDRHNELALIQHSRYAEQALLAKIKAAGTQVTSGKVLGAARDWLVQLDKASAAYRYRHRMEPNAALRVIAPVWLLDLIRSDIVMQMPGDGLDTTFALADGKIESWLRARNVNVTWSLDGQPEFGAQGAGDLLDYPGVVEWDIFAEGTFLFLDGGTLDLGIIRDSTLVGTNDYRQFVETFEAVAKVGVESLHVTSTLSECGSAAALVATCIV